MATAKILPQALQNFFSNGYLGVSFFFILSGFILTYVYQGKFTGNGALKRFFLARFARIYPVYALSLALMLPFITCVSPSSCLPQFFLIQMWAPLQNGAFTNWNGPAWTLSIEMVFYLTLPLWLAILSRLSIRILLFVVLGLSLAMILFRLPTISSMAQSPYAFLGIFPLPLLRLGEFVYGISLALIFFRTPHSKNLWWTPHTAMMTTIFLMCVSGSLWIAPAASIGFGLIIFSTASYLQRGILASFLSSRIMVLLGGASYSLYVLQTPVRAWVRMAFDGGPLETISRFAYQPLMLVVAISVFLIYEEPARAKLKSITQPTK